MTIYGAADLGLRADDCGQSGSLTEVASAELRLPGLRHGARQADLRAGAARLLEMIREAR